MSKNSWSTTAAAIASSVPVTAKAYDLEGTEVDWAGATWRGSPRLSFVPAASMGASRGVITRCSPFLLPRMLAAYKMLRQYTEGATGVTDQGDLNRYAQALSKLLGADGLVEVLTEDDQCKKFDRILSAGRQWDHSWLPILLGAAATAKLDRLYPRDPGPTEARIEPVGSVRREAGDQTVDVYPAYWSSSESAGYLTRLVGVRSEAVAEAQKSLQDEMNRTDTSGAEVAKVAVEV